ncbi:MAG: hypothetical protein ACOC1K_01620 [Nanoarchaeota archaeon]
MEELYKFLGNLLTEIEVQKFIVYVISILLFMSLPSLLSLLRESVLVKKVKILLLNNKSDVEKIININSKKQIRITREIEKKTHEIINKTQRLADIRANILDKNTIPYFITPVYKNVALRIYKNIDLMLYENDFVKEEKELKLLIKRDISILFKRAYNILNHYRYINGHKLSYYINDNWEHWMYKSVEDLLFKKNIPIEKIRIHLWNLLDTSIDEIIREYSDKIK